MPAIVPASASAGASPARSLAATNAQIKAVSQLALSLSKSAAGMPSASRSTALAAADAAPAVPEPAGTADLRRGVVGPPAAPDQPRRAPLRLKSQLPSVYGAAAA